MHSHVLRKKEDWNWTTLPPHKAWQTGTPWEHVIHANLHTYTLDSRVLSLYFHFNACRFCCFWKGDAGSPSPPREQDARYRQRAYCTLEGASRGKPEIIKAVDQVALNATEPWLFSSSSVDLQQCYIALTLFVYDSISALSWLLPQSIILVCTLCVKGSLHYISIAKLALQMQDDFKSHQVESGHLNRKQTCMLPLDDGCYVFLWRWWRQRKRRDCAWRVQKIERGEVT